MTWLRMVLIAHGLALLLLGCSPHGARGPAQARPCVPPPVTPAHLRGTVVASYAIRPDLTAVRVRTEQGAIVMYWAAGEVLVGLDLAPDNPQTPIWLRDPGEDCRWRYGQEQQL